MTDLELDSLQQKVLDLGMKVDLTNLQVRLHSAHCDRKLTNIANTLNSLEDDTQEEIESLTNQTSDQSDRIQAIEEANYKEQIASLTSQVNVTKEQLEDMDAEHHKEIDTLRNKAVVQTDRIDKTNNMLDNIIEHKVLSEEEYLALGTPDADVLYFTYE